MAEFLAMDANTSAVAEAERFIQGNWPRIYFFRLEPWVVAQREDQLLNMALAEAPEADDGMVFIAATNRTESGLVVPSTTGRTIMTEKARLEPIALGLKANVRDAVLQRLVRIETDAEEYRKMMAAPTQPFRQRATRSVAELLLRGLFLKGRAGISANDTLDLLHACVPMAYCEYVLLDGKWCDLARRATEEMRAIGIAAPLARVYSRRDGGVEQFLKDLEQGG